MSVCFNGGEKGAAGFVLWKSEAVSNECFEIWLLFFPCVCGRLSECAVLPSNINALLLQLKGIRARSHRGLGAAPQPWMRPPGRGQVLIWRRMTWTSSLPPLRRSCLPSPPLDRVPAVFSETLPLEEGAHLAALRPGRRKLPQHILVMPVQEIQAKTAG